MAATKTSLTDTKRKGSTNVLLFALFHEGLLTEGGGRDMKARDRGLPEGATLVCVSGRYWKVAGIPALPKEKNVSRYSSLQDRPWGPPNLLYNGYRVSFPGRKRPRRGVNHPPPSRADVKETLELYGYPPPPGLHGLFLGELYFLPFTLVYILDQVLIR